MKKLDFLKAKIGLLPTFGIIVFVILFEYSSTLYPGGSQLDVNSIGFDWVNNYWCNLMNEKAINNQANPARYIAITAMIILCISLALFFIQFSIKLVENKLRKRLVQIFGVISMILAALMFTKYHDLMTILSSLFGIIVVFIIIWEVYRKDLKLFKYSGIVSIILLICNNYIYYTGHFLSYLPLLQKITFIIILVWIVALNMKLSKI